MHSFFSLIVFYFEYIPFFHRSWRIFWMDSIIKMFVKYIFCWIADHSSCILYMVWCVCVYVCGCVCVECVCVQLCMWSVYVCGVCMCVVMCVECIYILHFSFKDYVIQVSMKRLFWKLVFPSLHVEIKRWII